MITINIMLLLKILSIICLGIFLITEVCLFLNESTKGSFITLLCILIPFIYVIMR